MDSDGILAANTQRADVVPARISKAAALSLAQRLTPQYAEALRDLQRGSGRFQFQPRIAAFRDRIGGYVRLYESEKYLGLALVIGILGEDELKKLNEESKSWSPTEQQRFLDEIALSNELELEDVHWPESESEWQAIEREVRRLPVEEQKILFRRATFFWSGFFGVFFNFLSLMVHGASLTSLVHRAIDGNSDAFLKAVQMDRLLLTHHAYFRERKLLAQDRGEREFLSKLAYRESNSPLRGKITYPGLYMLFGILDALRWLDDLRHIEILDVCDAAKLDRYQNRIEDVNYLTKRLREYRRWQKTRTLSMH